MRYPGIALLLSLLGFSRADATVYVWEHPKGVLVVTNDERDLPTDPGGQLTTYATKESAPSGQTPSAPSGQSPPVAASGRRGQRVLSTDQGLRAGGGGRGQRVATGERGHGGASSARATRAGSGAQGHRGDALTSSFRTPARDPRSLLRMTAHREPPQVIVRVVRRPPHPFAEATVETPTSTGSAGSALQAPSLGALSPGSTAGSMSSSTGLGARRSGGRLSNGGLGPSLSDY